jgi:methylated-DNA-[protein]-cysteine S-methyltransferase
VLDFEYRKMRKIVDSRIKKNLKAEFVEQDTQVLRETRKQLDEYFFF